MIRGFFQDFSEKNFKIASFLFSSLLLLSVAFFVFADDETSGKNIFQDSDQDGLSNDEEKLYGTDPLEKDTDGDGYSDGVEVESGYDPLKPAPGDKIVEGLGGDDLTDVLSQEAGDENLTEKISQEIATVLKDDGETESISLTQVDEAVQKALSGTLDEEIVLPEVSMDEIKIKKLPKNLKGDDKEEYEKKVTLEYLTMIAYIFANNSPMDFQNSDQLGGILSTLSTESVSAMTSGNMMYVDELSKTAEKILDQIKDVEVPESMIDTHIKAMKLTKYAVQLKTEVAANNDDPIGKIAVFAKMQGFFGIMTTFAEEVSQKVLSYGITDIPLEL